MSVYLHDIPLDQAQARFRQALAENGLWQTLEAEEIPLDEAALGRVTAAPVWAKMSSPHYHASAMDGFALRAEDTNGAAPTQPVSLRVPEQASYVDTGDALPEWANAVVPVEQVESLDGEEKICEDLRHPVSIRLRAALAPWMHVRPMGEDIVATQLVLPAGQSLRAVDLGAIAASGYQSVQVVRWPRVAILPTGTELIPIGQPAAAGEIIEYNSLVLAAQVRAWGGQPTRFSITADDPDLLRRRVLEAAAEHDLVLLNAGSSAGSEDFSARVIGELGEVLVHGVAVRPGHPVILGILHVPAVIEGEVGRCVAVIGVPGYPVSAALTAEIFVEPLLAYWLGRAEHQPVEVQATLTRKLVSPPGDDDYVRMVAGRVGERLLAAPLTRGAGVITSLVRADGIAIVPRGVQGLEAGDIVRLQLYRTPAELERTIFAIGSHDMSLDLLAQYLAAPRKIDDAHYRRRLVSSNVGSQAGLVALRRGEAHLAGSHLLDPGSGKYNLAALSQYLPGMSVRLVTWVEREQGLLVRRGNPLGLRGLEDLARAEVRYVNRQRGAGTRVLLDYHLQRLGIEPASIHGYTHEEYTHLAVAAAIVSGRADCGLGITAAAKALDLDFVSLYHERYDLVIPLEFAQDLLLEPLFDLMQDAEFRRAVAAMPGYKVLQMGKVVFEGKIE
ncbi:MAG TPA: molybdopterin biosynthesis protein [Anaerolineaceae bacterium]|nr:molybdopterin biosynthesis protein [Anaerolineaceae bacterium]